MTERKPTRRCAVYTRKSSEEGLEQSFNSLDAQREACSAYIASQRQEGWREVPTRYDDGGYSGGTLNRPALQQLLSNIRAGQIDLIVVYKIDRLTRSLTDFASLVTVLDAHDTSFVSVTQHFNTTTSMGRLTLNVLLSFAQFEREVTGERIRDKIAASKKKGMWMGGTVPLGYRSVDKKLIVVPEEAAQVRRLFKRYCALGSVAKLQDELRARAEVSISRRSANGRKLGGKAFSRGALYHVLRNRAYRGEIPHSDRFYSGVHEAIVPLKLWEAAQARLAENREMKRVCKGAKEPSLLAGMVQDDSGRPLTPSHTTRRGKRYRYYIGRPTKEHPTAGPTVPAYDLEQIVENDFRTLLGAEQREHILHHDPSHTAYESHPIRAAAQRLLKRWNTLAAFEKRAWLRAVLHHVAVGRESISVHWNGKALWKVLSTGEPIPPSVALGQIASEDSLVAHRIVARLQRCGSEMRIIGAGLERDASVPPHHATLLLAIARSRRWYEQLAAGAVSSVAAIARSEGLADRYVSRLLSCAYLAPNIVVSLIVGRASASLTLASVLRTTPWYWSAQEHQPPKTP